MGLMAQPEIILGATYLPYENTILIHVVNSTDKSIRIRNSYGASSGSLIQFSLMDKAGKRISLYDAVFYEGIDYQRFVSINPRSTKTFRFPLKYMCPSSHSLADVYSVMRAVLLTIQFRKKKDLSLFIRFYLSKQSKI